VKRKGIGSWLAAGKAETRGIEVKLEEMAVVRPPTPIGDGKCPQATDGKRFAGEVTVADLAGWCAVEAAKTGVWIAQRRGGAENCGKRLTVES